MTLLALDLGQTIGYVKGDAVGPLEHGEFEMPQTNDLGRWLQGADPFLRSILPGATAVAVEQPFLGRDYYPARKLLALLGHCAYWARFYGIGKDRWSEIPVSTGKLALSGSGLADKNRMIAAAAERGYPDLTEHAADALGIFWVWQFGAVETKAQREKRQRDERKGRIIQP